MRNAVVEEVGRRSRALVAALEDVDLLAPSVLPGWSRLTIVCHLRYGAEAMARMTREALAGHPTAYYPDGRDRQRPGTLELVDGESPAEALRSLRATSGALETVWADVDRWDVTVTEPADNADLGPYPLRHMPIFRLTEIEVHGTDLGIGLGPWSDVLIEHGTPMRLERLVRRTPSAPGAWRLTATDAPLDVIVGDGSEPEVIEATSRELFALTLGRIDLSASFARAYPGP